ncbi:heavy metal-associated isoprenylated plant protein 16-like isoform X2 [Papaver somniferum]|uniref:heavy metal-associated isoprenylated plant protein 16-like isoform X2 n=1 Tax=Papaver somniferum TaxID=3469 RepID=UPI000E701397|nr:heavy metal-associated isoprenylated plant protein 16-like isoform X2 [Papaver somniferum]
MKQKIVIEVQMHCSKCRSKALKIAAVADVDFVGLEGPEKDKVVIGHNVDCAGLTSCLRKKFGHANIIKIEEVKPEEKKPEEKKPEEKKPDEKKSDEKIPCIQYPYGPYPYFDKVIIYQDDYPNNRNCCQM